MPKLVEILPSRNIMLRGKKFAGSVIAAVQTPKTLPEQKETKVPTEEVTRAALKVFGFQKQPSLPEESKQLLVLDFV
jgi:hypothetical protein